MDLLSDGLCFSCLPFLWKSREQIHRFTIALHQHLANTCSSSEVAVYLKWWMGIEEVRIGTATVMLAILVNLRTNVGEQLAVYLVSLVGTMQTSPEVDSPACAPTSRIVALDFQSLGCSCSKLGCLCYRNLVERIETEQVRLMAMMPILVIPIVIPLHQVASLSNVISSFGLCGSGMSHANRTSAAPFIKG